MPKGRKRLSLKLRRGERPGLRSEGRKRKRFEHTIKRKEKDKLKAGGGERAKVKREKKEVQCVSREPAEWEAG